MLAVMKILFYTRKKPISTTGGIERATVNTARELTGRYGHTCYAAYSVGNTVLADSCFNGDFLVRLKPIEAAEDIANIVSREGIDVVVFQGHPDLMALLRSLITPEIVSVVFVYHFEPGYEMLLNEHSVLTKSFRFRSPRYKVETAIKLIGYPAFRGLLRYMVRRQYRESYDSSDALVLLLDEYVARYQEAGDIDDSDKFVTIPNALSYDDVNTGISLSSKQKVVLVVSRFDERHKRTSLILRAWERVKADARSNGWRLRIVGYGEAGPYLKKMVSKQSIPDVDFVGKRDPFEDYKAASIFLTTSITEGLPITLMEAQQCGVVPVAFDSCVPVRYIVSRGGILVPDKDVDAMAAAILDLMKHDSLLRNEALRCIEASNRFTWEEIGRRWNELLEKLDRTKELSSGRTKG